MRIRVALFAIVTLWSHAASGDTNTTLGDRSGEGSTPFTGLAQAPEASLFSGAVSTRVSIQVPPGRKNMTPHLALTYSSSGGAGPFGYGWDLSLGRIEVSTKWGVPRCRGDQTDDFVLVMPSGTYELRYIGNQVYRPRYEEGYLKAMKQAGDSWVVWDRSGTKYTFGNHWTARLTSTADCEAGFSVTSQWYLTQIKDTNGNTIDIAYSSFGFVYPSSVSYGGNSEQGLAHFYHVRFDYEQRPDQLFSARYGQTVLAARLQQIRIETDRPPAGTSSLIRAYRLTYDAELNVGYQSRLSEIAMYASTDPAAQPVLPPQQFSYSITDAFHGSVIPTTLPSGWEDKGIRAVASGQLHRSIMDMNGDGFPDLIYASALASWSVHFGHGDGTFDISPTTWNTPWAVLTPPPGLLQGVRETGGGSEKRTLVDTFDITGDGIPDYIVAAEDYTRDDQNESHPTNWDVYPGKRPAGSLGWRFDSTAIDWKAPAHFIRIDKIQSVGDNDAETFTQQDVTDLNGDGLPDLVIAPGGQSAEPPFTWSVYLNTRGGFDSAPASANSDAIQNFSAPSQWLSCTSLLNAGTDGEDGRVHAQLMDFNGDGLQDFVCGGWFKPAGCWCEPPPDGNITIHYGMGGGFTPSVWLTAMAGQNIRRWVHSSTVEDVADVNGDGLPDRLRLDPLTIVDGQPSEASPWKVNANQGGRFSATDIPWQGIAGPMRRQLIQFTRREMIDLNADGLLDRLRRNPDTGEWEVQLNQDHRTPLEQQIGKAPETIRPDLLTVLRNGLGGLHTMRYKAAARYSNNGADGLPDLAAVLWVVSDIRQTSGVYDVAPGVDPYSAANTNIRNGHELVSRYVYQDGRFDPDAREFVGFGQVYRIDRNDLPTEGRANAVLTKFGQSPALKGKVLQVSTYANSPCNNVQTECPPPGANVQPVLLEDNFWATDFIPGEPAGADRRRVYLFLTTKRRYDRSASAHLLTSTLNAVDAFGNLVDSFTWGTELPGLRTVVTYAAPQGTSEVRDRPNYSKSLYLSSGSEFGYSEKWFYYDISSGAGYGFVDKGNLERTETARTSSSTVNSYTEYDDYGNITAVIDENGNSTTFGYDDGALLHWTSQSNELGHTTTNQTDYRWGKPSVVTDPNGTDTEYAYDVVGRLRCLALPGDSVAGCTDAGSTAATERYTYAYADGTAGSELSRITTEKREPNQSSGYLASTMHFDALGRARYTTIQKTIDCASSASEVIVGDTEYDARGRVVKVYEPYLAPVGSRTNGATETNYFLNNGDDSTTHVDPLDRPSKIKYPTGAVVRMIYEQGKTTTVDQAGTKSATYVDAVGRVLREEVYEGATLYAWKTRVFDGAGRILNETQNDNPSTTVFYVYNMLGHQTHLIDPSSGTWVYQYDAVGNLTKQDDPKEDQSIKICYDKLNRPTKKFYIMTGVEPACTATGDIEYSYDATSYTTSTGSVLSSEGIGRLTAVTDQNGSSHTQYGVRGESLRSMRVVNVNFEETAGEFKFDYDVAGRLDGTRYPDGETIRTGYDETGQPQQLTKDPPGAQSIVEDTCYDVFGRVTKRKHQNGVTDSYKYHPYGTPPNDQTHRLARLMVALDGVAVDPPPAANTAGVYLNLGYPDYEARGFIEKIDDHQFTTSPLSNKINDFDYDHMGRLLSAAGTGIGESYSYDDLGRIETKGTRQFYYDLSSKPHQVTRTTVGGGPFLAVEHDANGNRWQKSDVAQSYEFDHEDRLLHIDVGGNAVDFAYDYQGQQVARTYPVQDFSIRYYGNLVETTSDGYSTKYYFLGGRRVASRRTTDIGWETAALDQSLIRFAATSIGEPAIVVAVSSAGQAMAALVLPSVLLLAVLTIQPFTKYRVVCGRAGASILAVIATLPWPIVLEPARSEATKGGGTALRHYHMDHLGSTQVITDSVGGCLEQVRYSPYGDVRGRFDCQTPPGAVLALAHRHEFTGYESEALSGLQYAGARFYDPAFGTFATRDPVAQFANPYTYTNWNPVNVTDPDGSCALFGIPCVPLLIGAIAATAIASAIDTGVQTGDVGAAFQALGIGIGVGVATAGLGIAGTIATSALGPTQIAIAAAAVAYGGYNVYQGAANGQIATAVVGGLLVAVSAVGLAEKTSELWSTASADSARPEDRSRAVAGDAPERSDLGPVGNRIRNHLDTEFQRSLFERYWLGRGGELQLSDNQFNAVIESIKNNAPFAQKIVDFGDKRLLRATYDFSGTHFDKALGTASVIYNTGGTPVGFYDNYNFNIQWSRGLTPRNVVSAAVQAGCAVGSCRPFDIIYGSFVKP